MGLLDVLGLAARGTSGTKAGDPPATDMIAIWNAAKHRVAAQLQALQGACAECDNEALQAVADADLLGDIDDPSLDLELAIMSGTDVAQALAAMRGAIKDDGEIEALDANPMGVPVTIAKTLLGALDKIASMSGGT